MDMAMPGMDGVAATARLATLVPEVAVLVLTMFEEDHSLLAAMRAGARGYLLKGAQQEEIERAVRGVAAGNAIFGSGVAAKLLGHVAAERAPAEVPFPRLTPREREVLDAIASGLGNSAIAARCGLSVKTVGNHISNIFAKLGVSDRTEAAILAREAGLGQSR
jgi:DNA-binding NarL/FixJ family response regulator